MSPSRTNRALLQDIRTALDDIARYIAGLDYDTFTQVRQIQHAVLFNLHIIGEAANRLDAGFRAQHPAVPWSAAIGMRNVIVHGYFAVNLEIVWNTVTEDLPPFKAQIDALLAQPDGGTDDDDN
jgi:uncharacterized protein with HEPN domain